MKKVTCVMLTITMLLFIIFSVRTNKSFAKEDKNIYLNILATDKLQYKMAKKLVGTKHNVQYICNNEEDIENKRYNIDSIINYKADIILYSGLNYEEWIIEATKDINKNKVSVIDVSRGIRTLNYEFDKSEINPYYWNGKEEYIIQLYNIKAAIEDKDPINREYYEKRYEKIVTELNNNIEEINESLDLEGYIFIAVDDYFDYFFKDLNIHINKIKEENIKEYIKKEDIDINKVIILKDSHTKSDLHDIKVINLYKEPSENSLLINYRAIQSI